MADTLEVPALLLFVFHNCLCHDKFLLVLNSKIQKRLYSKLITVLILSEPCPPVNGEDEIFKRPGGRFRTSLACEYPSFSPRCSVPVPRLQSERSPSRQPRFSKDPIYEKQKNQEVHNGKKDLERYGKGLLAHQEESCFRPGKSGTRCASVGRILGTRTPVSLDCFGAKLRFASRPRLFEKRRPKNFLSGSAAECLRCLFAPRLCRTTVRAAGFAGAFPPGHGLIGLSRSSPARRGTSWPAPPGFSRGTPSPA